MQFVPSDNQTLCQARGCAIRSHSNISWLWGEYCNAFLLIN